METVAPFKEVIEELKEAGGDAYRLCYQCGICDAVCPWNRVRKFSIRKIIREAAFGLTEIESDDIWRCTTCGTCPQECPRGVQQIDLGVSIRRLATNYDVFTAEAKPASIARGSLRTEGNPLGEERARRGDWAEGLAVRPFTEDLEVLLFNCCYGAYDPRMKKVARATAQLLDRAGVAFGTLGTAESCCGESTRKTGGEEVYRGLARANIKAFIDAGVKRIVVGSPHCYQSFKNDYREFMVNFEVLHLTEYLLELVEAGRLELTGRVERQVAYHDPCYLGRHNGIYDAPRELLRRIPGLRLVELADNRSRSLCCGGGGGRVWMDTPKGERFSDLRLGQARSVAAEVLATACPYCITMFEDSRLNLELEDELQVRDITELLLEAL